MNLLKIVPKVTKYIIPTGILQQTAFWARFKNSHGWQSMAFDIFEPDPQRFGFWEHTGDILILLKELQPGNMIAYAPYGPEIIPAEEMQGRWLENLAEELRKFLPETCFAIRFDLTWPSPWYNDNEDLHQGYGIWNDLPDTLVQEMRLNIGTKNWNLRKAPTNVLPSNTVIIPLDNKPENLLKRMKSKTRYNINLSSRKDIHIRTSDVSDLDAWFELYRQTTLRHGIAAEEREYFQKALTTPSEDTISPVDVHLLLAEKHGQPLAGMFLALSGNRATYLFGASASHHRDLMAPYLLQWEAMMLSRENGCNEYDLFGISGSPDPAHPMYGLYRFKTGFGGDIRHQMGCWDYPLHKELYEGFRIVETVAVGYHG